MNPPCLTAPSKVPDESMYVILLSSHTFTTSFNICNSNNCISLSVGIAVNSSKNKLNKFFSYSF